MSWRAKRMEKRRLEKLLSETGGYLNGAFRDRNGVIRRWWPYSANNNTKKDFRRISNRRFRRRKNEYWREDILQRSQHKKSFDLWWELW